MLLPLVFALAPQAFVDAVDHRIANTQLHVVDWWADDLDGDKLPEAIARVCDESSGFFLVLHGTDLLEAPLEIDGRNDCDAAARPAWTTRSEGEVTQGINVHHGLTSYSYAIRDHRLVLVRTVSHGFEVNRDGSHTDEDDIVDYDKLTWSNEVKPGASTHGVLVVASDHPHRTTTIVGKTTITATLPDDQLTLHVHADRALSLRDCDATPCKITRLAKGDHDVVVDNGELEIIAGGTKYGVHVERLEVDQGYAPPSTPW